jgi:hypothetical protein
MGKLGLTKLTMAQTWGKPPPFPLIVYSMAGHRASIQMAFLSWDSQVGVLKFPKLGPTIEMRFKEKL